MIRTGYLFDAVGERDNWKLAWLKAVRGKSRDPAALRFRKRLDENLESLRGRFIAGTFPFGDYRYFTITDPKTRTICAASFPERIVHHAIMNVLDPVFERYQIRDSYACRRGKGTQAAVLRAFHLAKGNPWFLKMDVRKYFDSIDHQVLQSMLRRRIKDRRILGVLDGIIDSYETRPGAGLPIGNLTSQYFANHYLATLDHHAKEGLKCGPWQRYMDDMLVFGKDRVALEALYRDCARYCSDHLALELKPMVLDRTERGAPFLGFLVKPSGIFLAAKSRRRFRYAAARIDRELGEGRMGEAEASARMTSICSHTLLARARGFRYAFFHGRLLGRQPRESRRELEQRRVEPAFGQPQQQQPRQQEQ